MQDETRGKHLKIYVSIFNMALLVPRNVQKHLKYNMQECNVFLPMVIS